MTIFPDFPRHICMQIYMSTILHALIEHTAVPTPPHVYRAFKEGRLHVYNGPVAPILSDKRSISLISEQAHRFTAEEQAIIEDYFPWSRVVTQRRPSGIPARCRHGHMAV